MLSKLLYRLGTRQYPSLGHLTDRAIRGAELAPWGLGAPQPDTGSVMDLDYDGYGVSTRFGVSGAAVFPAMNATDSLSAIHAIVVDTPRRVPFNHHTATLMGLCRTAFESASQTIWILESANRDTRRRRATGMSVIGAGQKSSHLDTELKAHAGGKQHFDRTTLSEMREHHVQAKAELAQLAKLPKESASYTKMVTEAAKYLNTHRPAHLRPEIGSVDLTTRIEQQYRMCSSFTHGHNWATDFAYNVRDLGAMMADAVAVALYVTESAVALFEAQATNARAIDRRDAKFPARLQTSIDQFARLY